MFYVLIDEVNMLILMSVFNNGGFHFTDRARINRPGEFTLPLHPKRTPIDTSTEHPTALQEAFCKVGLLSVGGERGFVGR
jgi:hypothetical protein